MTELPALLADATERMRNLEARRMKALREARFDPRRPGRFVRRESNNRWLRDHAVRVEKLPHISGTAGPAEAWVCYSALRESSLRLRAEMPEYFGIRTDDEYTELTEVFGVRPPMMTDIFDSDALNGYVAFPKRAAPPVPKSLAAWIPVHGGVTYRTKDSFAAVWGFDTAHYDSFHIPRTDPEWILNECRLLHFCLVAAAEVGGEWKRADRESRIRIAERLQDLLPGGNLGFEALFHILCGEI